MQQDHRRPGARLGDEDVFALDANGAFGHCVTGHYGPLSLPQAR